MKRINFLMILIGSILAILLSCAKDHDDAASTTSTFTSSTTASGSITVGSATMSGTYASECTTSGVAANVSAG